MSRSPGPAIALVHSPLVGAGCWRLVAKALAHRRFPALAIDYGGVQASDGYVEVGARIATAAAGIGTPWVLAVHSAAGALAPVVACAARDPPAGVLFVDAVLPHPGLSWLDAAPPDLASRVRALASGGRLPPWNRWFARDPADLLLTEEDIREAFVQQLPSLPLAYFETRAPSLVLPPQIAKGFLRLSPAYEAQLLEAMARSWVVGALEAHHLAMITDPDRVARAISHMVAAMLGA